MSNVTNFPHMAIEEDITRDGKTVSVKIYGAEQFGEFILEIVDQYWGSTVFDDRFPTAQQALDFAKQIIDEEGIDSFIGGSAGTEIFDVPTINRCAIIIRYKKPFVDWINSCDPKNQISFEDANDQPKVYLADEVDSDFEPDPARLVRAMFDEIFENELMGWYQAEAMWPQNRTWKMFQQFFDFSMCSIVHDLGAVPLDTDS